MEQKITSFCACDAQPPLRIENVPAHVCTMCGQKVFDQDVVTRIHNITRNESADAHLVMAVYDYSRTVRATGQNRRLSGWIGSTGVYNIEPDINGTSGMDSKPETVRTPKIPEHA